MVISFHTCVMLASKPPLVTWFIRLTFVNCLPFSQQLTYLVAFSCEISWILEARGDLPIPAYLLCAQFFILFISSAILIHGLSTVSICAGCRGRDRAIDRTVWTNMVKIQPFGTNSWRQNRFTTGTMLPFYLHFCFSTFFPTNLSLSLSPPGHIVGSAQLVDYYRCAVGTGTGTSHVHDHTILGKCSREGRVGTMLPVTKACRLFSRCITFF